MSETWRRCSIASVSNASCSLAYFYSGHTALRYAAKHPDRVKALVLIACSLSIAAWPLDSLLTLAERNWDAMLYNWVPPTATPEERAEYLAFFKQTRTQEDWLISARAFSVSDVEDVAGRVRVPTLVLHPGTFSGCRHKSRPTWRRVFLTRSFVSSMVSFR